MSEPVPYHAIGHQPDVAEGERHVYVTQVGSWTPLFSLTPDEADLFARRVQRAAARIRETQRQGPRPRRSHVDARHVAAVHRSNVAELPSAQRVEPFALASPSRLSGTWLRAGAVSVFIVGLVIVAAWAVSALGGAG